MSRDADHSESSNFSDDQDGDQHNRSVTPRARSPDKDEEDDEANALHPTVERLAAPYELDEKSRHLLSLYMAAHDDVRSDIAFANTTLTRPIAFGTRSAPSCGAAWNPVCSKIYY